MKKVLFISIVSVVFCSCIYNVLAKSSYNSIGYNEKVFITKSSTTGDLHTSILASTVTNGPITVENTVQRKESNTWYNKGKGFFIMNKAGDDKNINYRLGSTADTRSVWVNTTSNSFLQGTFYINNGLV